MHIARRSWQRAGASLRFAIGRAAAANRSQQAAWEYSVSDNNDPKLCPAPEPDTPHGSSERAKDYEDDVHARVNPLAPLPREFGVNLTDPLTGKKVFYEDCFRYTGDLVDGDMQKGDLAEAKGPGYEWLMYADEQKKADTLRDLEVQAEKQLRTAEEAGRGLKWYFADPNVADQAHQYFKDNGLDRIVISVMPPRKRK